MGEPKTDQNGVEFGSFESAVLWLRAQPDQREVVLQCYYDDPVIGAAARFCASNEWEAIRDLLGVALPGRVLELGAGRGIASFAFACAGSEVTAVEPDGSSLVGRGAIQELSAFAPQAISVVAAQGEDLPVASGSFDVVFSRAVLHHTRDLGRVCREVARVLRPGGLFLAEREHVIDRIEDLPKFLAAHPLHHRYGGENAFRLEEYEGALRTAGLRIARTIPPFHHEVNFVPPMDRTRLRMMTRAALCKFVPEAAATWLAQLRPMRDLYARTLSWRCKAPGRFYSFLAEKPK